MLPSALYLAINGKHIQQVSQTKSVGVHTDQNLSWNVHIGDVSKNIAFGIAALKSVQYFTLTQHYSTFLIRWFNLTSITAALCGTTKPMLLSSKNYRIERQGF